MEFIYYVIVFFLGWYARGWYIGLALRYILDKMAKENIEATEPITILLKFEMKDAVIYAYDEATNVFLAYGKDIEEIKAELEKRFPDKNFSARKIELQKIGIDI
jgi:hypothetical protein